MPLYRNPTRFPTRSGRYKARQRRAWNSFVVGNEGGKDPDVYTHTKFGTAAGSGTAYQLNISGHAALIDSRSAAAKASAAGVTLATYNTEMVTPVIEIQNASTWSTGPNITNVLIDINRTTGSPVFDAVTIYKNPGTPGQVLQSPGDATHGGSTSTRVRWNFTNGIPPGASTNLFSWYQDLHPGGSYDFRDLFWDGVDNAWIRVLFDDVDATVLSTFFVDFTDTDSFYVGSKLGVTAQSVVVSVPAASDYHGWYSMRQEYAPVELITAPTTFVDATNENSEQYLQLPGCQQYGNKPMVLRHAIGSNSTKHRVRVFAEDGETIDGSSDLQNLPGETDSIELVSDGVSDWETVWREDRAIAHVSKGSLLLATTVASGGVTNFTVQAPTTVVLIDATLNNALVRIDYPEQFEAGILIFKRVDGSANTVTIQQTGFNYFEDGTTTSKTLTSQYETLVLYVDYSSNVEGICYTAFQGVP